MVKNFTEFKDLYELTPDPTSVFRFKNEAGFEFDLKHQILDGYYYKQEQQEIVVGFDGSSRFLVAMTCEVLAMNAANHFILTNYVYNKFPQFQKLYNWLPFRIVFDVCNTYGLIVLMCVFNDKVHWIQASIWASALMVFFVQDSKNRICTNFLTQVNPKPSFDAKFTEKDELKQIRFNTITMTKSITLAITCVAIMTVDYPPLFPRYLCKTEDYGWSLMDVGVASVMFTSGMSSKLIVQHQTASRRTPNFVREMIATFQTNKLVMLAASIRFFLLTGIDYHDHVTEWGVHWNFFLTIAVINVLQVFIRSSKFALLYAFVILLLQEFVQQHWDLKTYILHAPRIDMVSANREGLISLAGYFSLQLIGMGIGRDFYQTLVYDEPRELLKQWKTKAGLEQKARSERKMFFKMVIYSVALWLGSELCYKAFDVPSRRLCNMSWVLYESAVMMSGTTMCHFFERMSSKDFVDNVVIKAINLNQLIFFACSNLLCGLINITVQTLHLPIYVSLLLLATYSTLPTAVYLVYYKKQFKDCFPLAERLAATKKLKDKAKVE